MKTLRSFSAGLLACLFLSASVFAAEPQWKRLKVGMSSAEALKHLGEPLLRAKARGMEHWIYDGAGEVFFAGGPVKYWTAATPSAESLEKPVETDVLFRAARPIRLLPVQPVTPAMILEREAAEGPRFRYR